MVSMNDFQQQCARDLQSVNERVRDVERRLAQDHIAACQDAAITLSVQVMSFNSDVDSEAAFCHQLAESRDQWLFKGTREAWLIITSAARAKVLNEVCRLRLQPTVESAKTEELWLRNLRSLPQICKHWQSEPTADQLSSEPEAAVIYEDVLVRGRACLKILAESNKVDFAEVSAKLFGVSDAELPCKNVMGVDLKMDETQSQIAPGLRDSLAALSKTLTKIELRIDKAEFADCQDALTLLSHQVASFDADVDPELLRQLAEGRDKWLLRRCQMINRSASKH